MSYVVACAKCLIRKNLGTRLVSLAADLTTPSTPEHWDTDELLPSLMGSQSKSVRKKRPFVLLCARLRLLRPQIAPSKTVCRYPFIRTYTDRLSGAPWCKHRILRDLLGSGLWTAATEMPTAYADRSAHNPPGSLVDGGKVHQLLSRVPVRVSLQIQTKRATLRRKGHLHLRRPLRSCVPIYPNTAKSLTFSLTIIAIRRTVLLHLENL